MTTRRAVLVFVAVVASVAAARAADTAKCEAAKQKATGKKVAAKLACWATATKRAEPVDPECLAKAEAKFLAAFQKAETGDCEMPGNAASVESAVDVCVGDLLAVLVPTTTVTTTSSSSTTSTSAPVPTTCEGQIYACINGADDDADGLVDALDPDCTGACDNSEDSFFPNIPGLQLPACRQDCFWDANIGSGDDACYWDHRCDPLEVPPNYYPTSYEGATCAYTGPGAPVSGTGQTCAELSVAQPPQCAVFCGPLTPNGCDCFGCCELPAGSGLYVFVGSIDGTGAGTCDAAHVSDPTKCQPCTPVPACLNACSACELCVGKSDIEPGCGGQQACPAGAQACGLAGQPPCPTGSACVTGCCQPTP